ncbi:MAG: hypothetical protein GXY85_10170 [Candidatus Brocadiaceae bacterium]|nr:hypothetical protein [Candidatus Brocadiaceae bacterium]
MLEIQVDCQTPDSLSAGLCALLSRWGEHVPYECIAGLSGASFSPALRRQETCASCWMDVGSDARLEFLGNALGFSVEALPQPLTPEQARRVACQALKAGDGVLVASQHGWTLLPEWPVRLDPQPPDAMRLYILRPATRYLSRCEALRDALRHASQVANGYCAEDGVAYGGELYAAWQERLGWDAFCPECGNHDWLCAERTARRAQHGQRAAARFLNRAAALLPRWSEDAALLMAENAYNAMARKLTPYTAPGAIAGWWHDRAARARFEADVAEVADLHVHAALSLACLACRL